MKYSHHTHMFRYFYSIRAFEKLFSNSITVFSHCKNLQYWISCLINLYYKK